MYDNRVFVLDRATDQITNPFKAYKGNYEFRARCPLLTSSTGKVFASMNDGHLYMMELNRKGLKSEQIAADGVAITCLVEGFEDEIWIGTKKGIHRLDRTNLSIERNAILPNEAITSLHAHGFSIYAGTASGAIYSFVYGQEPKLLRSRQAWKSSVCLWTAKNSSGSATTGWVPHNSTRRQAKRNSSSSTCPCPNMTVAAACSTRATVPSGW